MALLRALSALALGGIAAEAQAQQYLALSDARVIYWANGSNCTGQPLRNQTLSYVPPGTCMTAARIEGCLTQTASGMPQIAITSGCDQNCSKCSGTPETTGQQKCLPDPSGSGAMMMFMSYTCVPSRGGGNGTGGNESDPRDEQCMPYRDQWEATGCSTFVTQPCNGAELRFADAKSACGSQYPCKVALFPSAPQLLNASSCAAYCGMHGLQCVAAWYRGPSGASCDVNVTNSSCGGALSVDQGAEPMCECGGYASTPTGPTALETRIASQCMSLLSGFYQCMDVFRQADPEYYHMNMPPQGIKERVAWAMGNMTTPRCTFIPGRLAQRIGAVPCSMGAAQGR